MLPVLGLLSLAVAGPADTIASPQSPVPITIYYETLCPYSIEFILNKLLPAYRDLNGLMSNVTLVPYGHVQEIDSDKFQYACQHGVPECGGNKLHGCAINYIKDKRILLNYLSCLMDESRSSDKQGYPVGQCTELVPYNILPQLAKCFYTNEGWLIFNQNGDDTDRFFGSDSFYVPYVSFNNVRNDDLSDLGIRDFKQAVCIVNGVRGNACTDGA